MDSSIILVIVMCAVASGLLVWLEVHSRRRNRSEAGPRSPGGPAEAGDIAPAGSGGDEDAVRREDGSWLLDGALPVEEFKEIFPVGRLPGEERSRYHTLAGFVMTYLGRIPAVADRFEWEGLRFEVVDMDGKRIDKVLVAPAAEQSAASGEQD